MSVDTLRGLCCDVSSMTPKLCSQYWIVSSHVDLERVIHQPALTTETMMVSCYLCFSFRSQSGLRRHEPTVCVLVDTFHGHIRSFVCVSWSVSDLIATLRKRTTSLHQFEENCRGVWLILTVFFFLLLLFWSVKGTHLPCKVHFWSVKNLCVLVSAMLLSAHIVQNYSLWVRRLRGEREW